MLFGGGAGMANMNNLGGGAAPGAGGEGGGGDGGGGQDQQAALNQQAAFAGYPALMRQYLQQQVRTVSFDG